ncbi:MAG TPA: HEAT repeat domain-containing protein [Gemmataceae bacterium]|nr:HEAT repeat domain-containing protein [Gemmataceae bacterium]
MPEIVFSLCVLITGALLEELLPQGNLEEAVAKHIQAMNDPNAAVRYRAAEALQELGDDASAAVPALREALKDKQSFVRRKVAEALGSIGREARHAVPGLIALLKDPSEYVREEAAIALGNIGPDARDALPALRAALTDSTRYVRRAAEAALGEIDVSWSVVLKNTAGPVEFSADGKMAASYGRQCVILWDTATWKKVAILSGASMPCAFSRDGKFLINGKAEIWDVSNEKTRGKRRGDLELDRIADRESVRARFENFYSSLVRTTVFTDDGKCQATLGEPAETASRCQVTLVTRRAEKKELEGHEAPIDGITFSADGKWLASADCEATIKLWDTHTGKELLTIPKSRLPKAKRPAAANSSDHSSQTLRTYLAFTPDGKYLLCGACTADAAQGMKVWELSKLLRPGSKQSGQD